MGKIKVIKLSGKRAAERNAYAVVDEEDFSWVQSIGRWHLSSTGYAVMRVGVGASKRTIRMHRLVNRTPEGLFTDHINHDRLDNRKANLRTVTQKENMRNLKDHGKGYWRHSQNKNWVVEVYGEHICCVDTEAEAIKAVAIVRAGGTYVKPERTECRHGHSLSDAYVHQGAKRCRTCQANRSKTYYRRKNTCKRLQAVGR